MKEISKNLVGYCGLYCGACGIYQGKIKQAVENLRKVTKAYGFDRTAPELAKWQPAFQHYAEYEKVLDGWIKIFSECPGCMAGGGDPNCAVRNCCKERGFTNCAECTEIKECEKLKKYGSHALEGIKKIKAMGVDKWAEEMRRKVDAGYCYLNERI